MDPFDPETTREQIIIVVREDWTVTCYDARFTFLWEKAVAHNTLQIEKYIDYFAISSVSVFIAPFSLTSNSSGVVVVGANMKPRVETFDINSIKYELGIDSNENVDENHPTMKALSSLGHFSIYALESSTGHVIWKHDGTEMKSDQFTKSLPQHAYTLDVNDLMSEAHHAPGFNDWTMFRRSLMDELPHSWGEPVDTKMKVANFVRRHIGAGAGQQILKDKKEQARQQAKAKSRGPSSLGKLSGAEKIPSHAHGVSGNKANALPRSRINLLKGVDADPVPADAIMPHSAAEHTSHPNVLVAHTQHGVEVVGLRTGRPVTALALPLASDARTYADVDGDGIIDTIIVLASTESVFQHSEEFKATYLMPGSSSSRELQRCSLVVISGLPPQSQLFNASLCHDHHSLYDSLGDPAVSHYTSEALIGSHSHSARSKKDTAGEGSAPYNQAHSAPLILKKLDPKTNAENLERDIIVAMGSGVVSSYTGNGQLNWQTQRGPTWSGPYDNAAAMKVLAFDADAARVSDLGSHNNLHASIVVVGDVGFQLIAADGSLLARAELPDRPLGRPSFGDFDNDGISDITIVTKNAILGYHVHIQQSSRTLVILLIIISTVALIVFLANMQIVTVSSVPGSRPTASQGHAAAMNTNKAIMRILRSTDDAHLD